MWLGEQREKCELVLDTAGLCIFPAQWCIEFFEQHQVHMSSLCLHRPECCGRPQLLHASVRELLLICFFKFFIASGSDDSVETIWPW